VWDEATESRPINIATIIELGKALQPSEQDLIQELWDDCNEEQRAYLYSTATQGTAVQRPEQRLLAQLVERGMLKTDGNTMVFASEAVRAFVASDAGRQSNLLSTIFGTSELFHKNIK